jgi:hypothetical protein
MAMKKIFDVVKKLLLSDVPLYKVLIVFGIFFLLVGIFVWMFYPAPTKSKFTTKQPMPVVIEKPKPESKPVVVEKLKKKPEILNNYHIGTLDFSGRAQLKVWFFQLNEVGIEAFKKGKVVLRLFVGYCQYDGTEVDKDGWVIVPTEWMPSLDESRISVGLFKITDEPDINSGYYLSSFLIKKAGANAPKGVAKELKVDTNPASEEGSVQNVKEAIPMEEMIAIQDGTQDDEGIGGVYHPRGRISKWFRFGCRENC